jgi:hypothetical protein
MKLTTTISLSALAVALLLGCTTRSLSVLQAEFNAAVEARANCPPDVVYVPKEASKCAVDYQTIFADIAAQTEKALTDFKGGTSVKIGLHRLHAYALWQSGATEKTIAQAARKGLTECAGDNYAKAPRDCALLATIGNLKGIEAVGAGIGEIYERFVNAADKKKECTQNAEGWRNAASDYWQNYYLPLAMDMNTFAARTETPGSVLQYLQDQHAASFDQLNKLKNIGRQCVSDDTVVKQLITCPCNPTLRTNEDQEACRMVFDADNPTYAFYYEAFCMSEDVFRSDDCPCGDENDLDFTDREMSACSYVKANPGAKVLHEARCRVEQALKEN